MSAACVRRGVLNRRLSGRSDLCGLCVCAVGNEVRVMKEGVAAAAAATAVARGGRRRDWWKECGRVTGEVEKRGVDGG